LQDIKHLCWPTAVEGRYVNTRIQYNKDMSVSRSLVNKIKTVWAL